MSTIEYACDFEDLVHAKSRILSCQIMLRKARLVALDWLKIEIL